jgi:hypothetical protein
MTDKRFAIHGKPVRVHKGSAAASKAAYIPSWARALQDYGIRTVILHEVEEGLDGLVAVFAVDDHLLPTS